jgi:predicted DNA-binding transcriptional regulator
MARAVSPWTWRRALRDHGPTDASVLLTLYVIGTYMNRDGYAYPNQELIARGARASARSVQRHIAAAKRAGWLAVELAGRGGKGWRFNAYRAAVPDNLLMDELDEKISDAIVSVEGDISDDTAMSPPTKVVPQHNQVSDDNGGRKVTTNGADGDDTGRHKVTTQLCRTNSGSETPALRTLAQREAQADARAASFPEGEREQEAISKTRQQQTSASLQKVLRAPAPKDKSNWLYDDDELRKHVRKYYEAGVDPDTIVKALTQYADWERIRRMLKSEFGVPWVAV